jgi:hypothetical protein
MLDALQQHGVDIWFKERPNKVGRTGSSIWLL